MSDITDSQKRYGQLKIWFSFLLCKINFKEFLDKYPNIYLSKTIMIFRVGAEMGVIFMDFSREKSWNNLPIDCNEQLPITKIVILDKTYWSS